MRTELGAGIANAAAHGGLGVGRRQKVPSQCLPRAESSSSQQRPSKISSGKELIGKNQRSVRFSEHRTTRRTVFVFTTLAVTTPTLSPLRMYAQRSSMSDDSINRGTKLMKTVRRDYSRGLAPKLEVLQRSDAELTH